MEDNYTISLRKAMEDCHKEVLASPQWLRIIYFRNAIIDFKMRGGVHEPKPQDYGLKYEGCECHHKLVDL